MATVNYRFVLGEPALAWRIGQKSFSIVSSPILVWSTSVQKLCLQLRDLVGMNDEQLSQFAQRLVAFYDDQSHLRLEGRCVVPAGSSRHGLSCAARILAAFRQKLHL